MNLGLYKRGKFRDKEKEHLKYMALGGRILLLPVLKKYGVVRVCAELM
jgi:hypothetical protein